MTSTLNPDLFDSEEVWDGEGADRDLEGYVLVVKATGDWIGPVRCCRTCAWSALEHVRYEPGVGYVYLAPLPTP